VTLGRYLDDWIEGHAIVIKPKTLKDYRDLIESYVKPHIGNIGLQALRPARITKFYRDLLESGGRESQELSARTVQYVHAVLRKALNDAVIVDQLLSSNPAERAKRPRVSRSEVGKVWTGVELKRFLDAAKSHRLHAFYHLAAYSGARRGELLNLRWSDVDLDAGDMHISGTATVIDGQRVEGTTKSGRSRHVSLDAETVRVLRKHLASQSAERLVVGAEWRGVEPYVFTTAWGEPVHPDTVSSLMAILVGRHNRTAAEAGRDLLPHARLHDLRHLHATTLFLAGVPVHVVAARLGHADPSVTLRVYAHVLNEQMVSVAEVFAQAVGEDAVSNPVSKLGPRRSRRGARKDKSPSGEQRGLHVSV
jgi:integrase